MRRPALEYLGTNTYVYIPSENPVGLKIGAGELQGHSPTNGLAPPPQGPLGMFVEGSGELGEDREARKPLLFMNKQQ